MRFVGVAAAAVDASAFLGVAACDLAGRFAAGTECTFVSVDGLETVGGPSAREKEAREKTPQNNSATVDLSILSGNYLPAMHVCRGTKATPTPPFPEITVTP